MGSEMCIRDSFMPESRSADGPCGLHKPRHSAQAEHRSGKAFRFVSGLPAERGIAARFSRRLRITCCDVPRPGPNIKQFAALAGCRDLHLPISAVACRVTGHVPDRVLTTDRARNSRPGCKQAVWSVRKKNFAAGHPRDSFQCGRVTILLKRIIAVSYTHLTLPTNREV